jgi:LmbE family N-acetylglucosaminyl deacetylase
VRNLRFRLVLASSIFSALCGAAFGQLPGAPPSPGPDDRFKADILVVVAHPDDETMATAYIAKQVFDEHKRVAVIFGTRGNSGGNAEGYEQAAALGAEREIEARRALSFLNVTNVWFLGGPDTASQNVLWSLETWHHGEALADMVRLVRLTRPKVILTWLPAYTAGENHGDHQAAGVLATEAFDLAGDPTAFAEQVTPPRDRSTIQNLTEGLHPWQPQKIYYFSDALHTEFLKGQGPEYSTLENSPSKGEPYYRLAAEEMESHLTQGDTGQMAKQALAKGDFGYFKEPLRLVFGKSVIKATTTGDIFEGTTDEPHAFVPAPGYRAEAREGVWMELGDSWSYYERFWKVHGIEHLANLLSQPEVSLARGTTLHIPMLIHNDTSQSAKVSLRVSPPNGFRLIAGGSEYPVRAHDTYPAEIILATPNEELKQSQELALDAESNGKSIGSIKLNVYVTEGGLPQ